MGCSVTLNLYDHLGTPLADEPEYGDMLRDTRRRMEALVAAYAPGGHERGIGMLHPEDGPRHKLLSAGAGYGDLSLGHEVWQELVQPLGFPITYMKSPVVAMSRQMPRACAGQLDRFFSRGVLLDLTGVETILSMGRGDLIGVEIAETFIRSERKTCAEEPIDAAFGGPGWRYMSVDHLGQRARIGRYELKGGASAVSMFVDPDRERVMPAWAICENRLGGRVAMMPYDIREGMGTWFFNWLRKKQLHGILAWLFRGAPPLFVEGGTYSIPIRTDYPDYVLVSALNLSSDPWIEMRLQLAADREVKEVARLDANGKWRRMSRRSWRKLDDTYVIAVPEELAPLDMVTLMLRGKARPGADAK
jgi:hypothetical protein